MSHETMKTPIAPKIREAIARVVHSLEIGEDRYDLAAVQFVTTAITREGALDFERRFVDELVEAVGRVLVDEDTGPLTDDDRAAALDGPAAGRDYGEVST